MKLGQILPISRLEILIKCSHLKIIGQLNHCRDKDYRINLTLTKGINNTVWKINNAQLFWAPKWQRAKLMNIKLPMYLFFYMTHGINDFDEGKSITPVFGRGGS